MEVINSQGSGIDLAQTDGESTVGALANRFDEQGRSLVAREPWSENRDPGDEQPEVLVV